MSEKKEISKQMQEILKRSKQMFADEKGFKMRHNFGRYGGHNIPMLMEAFIEYLEENYVRDKTTTT